jgi:hypothetical protein
MSFYQGQAAAFNFTMPVAASTISKFIATFIQDEAVVLEKTTTTFSESCWAVGGNKITLTLTEAETLAFSADQDDAHEKPIAIQLCGTITAAGVVTPWVSDPWQTTVKKRWHTGAVT